jgi:transcriptional regulator with XRE-family HTH domain
MKRVIVSDEEKARIGNAIKGARETIGLSQTALAARLGMTRGAVSQWEQAVTVPELAHLSRLSELLRIPITKLVPYATEVAGLMPVRGEVEKDVFRKTAPLGLAAVPISPNPSFPAERQYALLVRDNSCETVAAKGDYIQVVDIEAVPFDLKPGQVVVVERTFPLGTEVTVARLVGNGKARGLEFCTKDGPNQPPRPVTGGPDESVRVTALVIGRYTPMA